MISICEYLLSKNKKSSITLPEEGCSIKDLIEWVESFKIKRMQGVTFPNTGEVVYYTDDKTLINVIKKPPGMTSVQQVYISYKNDESTYLMNDGIRYDDCITFDKAIEEMQKMMEDPNYKFEI